MPVIRTERSESATRLLKAKFFRGKVNKCEAQLNNIKGQQN